MSLILGLLPEVFLNSVALAQDLAKDSELSGSQVELIFDSLIQLYERLRKLGFTYYEGKIEVIDMEEENA